MGLSAFHPSYVLVNVGPSAGRADVRGWFAGCKLMQSAAASAGYQSGFDQFVFNIRPVRYRLPYMSSTLPYPYCVRHAAVIKHAFACATNLPWHGWSGQAHAHALHVPFCRSLLATCNNTPCLFRTGHKVLAVLPSFIFCFGFDGLWRPATCHVLSVTSSCMRSTFHSFHA